MKLNEFLKLVAEPQRTNYFVLCSDELGLQTLLPKALMKSHPKEDIHVWQAADLTKENAKRLEKESRMAPRGTSDHTIFCIFGLSRLMTDSVGPLLKVVEEAKYARFVFQSQSTPRPILTLMSRSHVVRLPFLSKAVVLANLKAMNYDAKTVDQMGLYDGTLDGTRKALQMKEMVLSIKRETSRGLKGYLGATTEEILTSLAFETATNQLFSREEKAFMRRDPQSKERKKLVMMLALGRSDAKGNSL